MLAHLVSGRWGEATEQRNVRAQPGWFSRLMSALFGKRR